MPMKKYKKVRVECYKNGYLGYVEIFTDITAEQLEKQLQHFEASGFDYLRINTSNQKNILEVSKCEMCKHFNDENTWTCKAFPEKIPYEIISEKIEHDAIIEGQVGNFVFEERDA